jgi:hypothetical protein
VTLKHTAIVLLAASLAAVPAARSENARAIHGQREATAAVEKAGQELQNLYSSELRTPDHQALVHRATAQTLRTFVNLQSLKLADVRELLADFEGLQNRLQTGSPDRIAALATVRELEAAMRDAREMIRTELAGKNRTDQGLLPQNLRRFEEFEAARKALREALLEDEQARSRRSRRVHEAGASADALRWLEWVYVRDIETSEVLAEVYESRAQRIDRGLLRAEVLDDVRNAVDKAREDSAAGVVSEVIPEWDWIQRKYDPSVKPTAQVKRARKTAKMLVKRSR